MISKRVIKRMGKLHTQEQSKQRQCLYIERKRECIILPLFGLFEFMQFPHE